MKFLSISFLFQLSFLTPAFSESLPPEPMLPISMPDNSVVSGILKADFRERPSGAGSAVLAMFSPRIKIGSAFYDIAEKGRGATASGICDLSGLASLHTITSTRMQSQPEKVIVLERGKLKLIQSEGNPNVINWIGCGYYEGGEG